MREAPKLFTFCPQNGLEWTKIARKQGKIGPITQKEKEGGFKGFIFRLQLNFFPVFWRVEFFPPPPRGGRFWPKYLPLNQDIKFDFS